MSMELLDKSGLAYFWTKIKAYIAGLLGAKADDADVVHKAGDENVTGTKTFVGSKKVSFKQSAANDKLGFTLFDNSNVEQGYLEYNPTNKISGVPLMTLGNYATAAAGLAYVGFRKYSNISGAAGAYNLLTPLISDAKAPFNLTTTYTNFFLPLGVTDGTTTVLTAKSGLLDISPLLVSIDSSDAITAMTGYSKPSSGGAIAASDSLNAAIGKLEFKVDSVDDSNYVHLTGNEIVAGTKTFSDTISGSIDGNAATASAVAWSGVTGKPTTLAGYGITDANIVNGTITLGSNSITPLTSHQDISGKVNKSGDTMTGDLFITTGSANQIHLLQGNYGILLRNDGADFYILQTAYGDPWGIWNGARPFRINLSDGLCYINGRLSESVPVGSIIYHASGTVPANYLLCNGGGVSRTTYAALFNVIGTTFGAGDGWSTFNVPNLIGRFPEGSATPGTVHNAGLPNITGNTPSKMRTDSGGTASASNWNGPFQQYFTDRGGFTDNPNGWGCTAGYLIFDASKAHWIYGNSSTVQPPALTLVPCIRYI